MRWVPYELMETICEALDLEPRFVSEIRFRAPRTIEALVYRRDADGDKHLGDRGIVLERITFQIAAQTDEEKIADTFGVPVEILRGDGLTEEEAAT